MAEAQILNKMEAAVKRYILDLSDSGTLDCSCERCQMDIMALALNTLPPKYVVTELGEVFTNVNLDSTQWKADIMMAIHQAQAIVNKKPRH